MFVLMKFTELLLALLVLRECGVPLNQLYQLHPLFGKSRLALVLKNEQEPLQELALTSVWLRQTVVKAVHKFDCQRKLSLRDLLSVLVGLHVLHEDLWTLLKVANIS